MNWMAGQTLDKGKYTIERKLGQGRFGITYLTKQSDGTRWVIKILDPIFLSGLAQDERDRQEMLLWNEAVKLGQCEHPNIVRMASPFKEGSIVCLPMEYLDGSSLAERSQPILLESKALEYVQQIGAALEVVHSKQLVHRDVRPANIFLRIRDGQAEAVLTDFGLAVDVDSELSRTRTTEIMDGFSPIELYSRGNPVGAYTDVYSLAATLYELLTGVVPVSAQDRKINGQTLVSPQEKNTEISGKTTKAILAGLALEPEKRPQFIQAWLKLLRIPDPTAETVVKTGINWTKWQAIWGAVAALMTLIVGIPAWFALNKSEPSAPPSPSATPIQKASPNS
jgi:serine/threonine protein kinase